MYPETTRSLELRTSKVYLEMLACHTAAPVERQKSVTLINTESMESHDEPATIFEDCLSTIFGNVKVSHGEPGEQSVVVKITRAQPSNALAKVTVGLFYSAWRKHLLGKSKVVVLSSSTFSRF
jgi:hypothetical protein